MALVCSFYAIVPAGQRRKKGQPKLQSCFSDFPAAAIDREKWSTSKCGPVFPVGPVGILVECGVAPNFSRSDRRVGILVAWIAPRDSY